jgi:type II secretory pathway component PulF
MAKHPKVFSRVYVALVRAGETAGIMEKIMMRLAENSEKSREFRSKVIGAMIYPIIILIGMVVVVVVMMVVVIPKLSALYADFGSELPPTTKAVIAISNFSVKFWWLVVVAVAGLGMAFRVLINTEAGRFQWDAFLYKLPVTGPLAKQVMLTEITRTMGLLVGAGVSVVEALNIVAETSGNVVIKKELIRVAKQVEKGFPISISFSESEIFPPLIGQMVAVGEETGKLDDVLAKLSGYFESESTEKIKGLTTAIEPLILVVLAVGVGFLMYAIIIPIYQITDQI